MRRRPPYLSFGRTWRGNKNQSLLAVQNEQKELDRSQLKSGVAFCYIDFGSKEVDESYRVISSRLSGVPRRCLGWVRSRGRDPSRVGVKVSYLSGAVDGAARATSVESRMEK